MDPWRVIRTSTSCLVSLWRLQRSLPRHLPSGGSGAGALQPSSCCRVQSAPFRSVFFDPLVSVRFSSLYYCNNKMEKSSENHVSLCFLYIVSREVLLIACRWHSMHAVCSDPWLAPAGVCGRLQSRCDWGPRPGATLRGGAVSRECTIGCQPSLQPGEHCSIAAPFHCLPPTIPGMPLLFCQISTSTAEAPRRSSSVTFLLACLQAGRLGAIGAPGFVLLGSATGAAFLPYIVFGSLILLAGISMPALPETLDAPQPESVQARNGSSFVFPGLWLCLL